MKHIKVERDDGVGVITIDRGERFNSLDVATAQDLRKAGPAARARRRRARRRHSRRRRRLLQRRRPQVHPRRRGRRRPGLSRPQSSGGRDDRYGELFKQILEYIHSTISEIRRAPKPFIAAVDGVAAAGGLGIAMACDLVVASERATFEWAYIKTGLTGAESSTFFLPKLVGLRRAMELVLLNPRLDPQRALRIGLINEVYPAARSRPRRWRSCAGLPTDRPPHTRSPSA